MVSVFQFYRFTNPDFPMCLFSWPDFSTELAVFFKRKIEENRQLKKREKNAVVSTHTAAVRCEKLTENNRRQHTSKIG
jgi:hypothetical protein